jgi:hypothetical protein
MRHTSIHSSSLTGWTDNRIEVTRRHVGELRIGLDCFQLTGLGMSMTAFTSTQSQRSSSVVESG